MKPLIPSSVEREKSRPMWEPTENLVLATVKYIKKEDISLWERIKSSEAKKEGLGNELARDIRKFIKDLDPSLTTVEVANYALGLRLYAYHEVWGITLCTAEQLMKAEESAKANKEIYDNYIASASKMPLNDAALYLYLIKGNLDQYESQTPLPTAKAYPDFINRKYGLTYQRMKKAHVNANDKDLQNAIELAIKLELDAIKNFSYTNNNLVADAKRAVDQARKDNPFFGESSYGLLVNSICCAMR